MEGHECEYVLAAHYRSLRISEWKGQYNLTFSNAWPTSVLRHIRHLHFVHKVSVSVIYCIIMYKGNRIVWDSNTIQTCLNYLLTLTDGYLDLSKSPCKEKHLRI